MDTVGDFVPLLAALALAVKVVDFGKYLTNKDTNGAVTQLFVWIAGVGVVLLLGATDFSSGVSVGGMTLSEMNIASQVFFGLTVGSSGSFAYDFKKSFDNTDSAQTPTLLH